MTDLIEKTLREANDALHELVWNFCGSSQAKTESPIERALLEAMIARCICVDGIAPYLMAGGEEQRWTILCQHQIGSYRVDFMVSHPSVPQPIVIECDGHEFHERTKEQAERDRSRDRNLTEQGYRVLRFTGREIWRSPWNCAIEIENQFVSMMHAEWERSQGD